VSGPLGYIDAAAPASITASYLHTYQLYDIAYQSIAVADWHLSPPDRAPSGPFWQGTDAFQPCAFSANWRKQHELNDLCPLSWVGVGLVMLIVLLAVLVSRRESGVFGVDSTLLTVTYPLSFFWCCLVSLSFKYFTTFLLRFGIFVAGGIAVAAVVIAAALGTAEALGILVPIAFIVIVYYFCYDHSAAFAVRIVEFMMTRFASIELFMAWGFGFLLLIGICFLATYVVYYAAALHWSGWVYVPILYFFWYLVHFVGQIVFQIIAQLIGFGYFTQDPHDLKQGGIWRRALIDNLGISAFNAAIIPCVLPFYWFAKLDPMEVRDRPVKKLPEVIGRILSNLFAPIHNLAIGICVCLDREFSYPFERGAIYSALFGISRAEGTRRVAEIDAKAYLDLLTGSIPIDALLGHIAILLETAGALVGWATGRMVGGGDRHIERVGAAVGFFVAFPMLHLFRVIVRASIETLFICFYEFPDQMQTVAADVDELIRRQYEMVVTRRTALEFRRSEMALLNRETLW
jgi:hypothetical protein